jgi:hypothetical protein
MCFSDFALSFATTGPQSAPKSPMDNQSPGWDVRDSARERRLSIHHEIFSIEVRDRHRDA